VVDVIRDGTLSGFEVQSSPLCLTTHGCIQHIHRYILLQQGDSEVVQATVAAVFIQDIDEIVYRVFVPASFKTSMPEFETPPYNNQYFPPHWKPTTSLRYRSIWIRIMHAMAKVFMWVSLYLNVILVVSASVAVVVILRQQPNIQC
jgi:hypothetical protein